MPATTLNIKLEGLEMSTKQLNALEKEVNAVVTRHVAATTQTGVLGFQLKINPEWLGIWLKKFKDLPSLKEKGFKQFKNV